LKRLSPRELKRLQSRMLGNLGLDVEELGTAESVTIRLSDREIVLKNPVVVSLKMDKEKIFQVIGGEFSESVGAGAAAIFEPSPEDVLLVVSQAGVSEEIARKALIDTGGDLAKAILLLRSRS
jgi:nascent polypeptide-associated complex subunit alpha